MARRSKSKRELIQDPEKLTNEETLDPSQSIVPPSPEAKELEKEELERQKSLKNLTDQEQEGEDRAA